MSVISRVIATSCVVLAGCLASLPPSVPGTSRPQLPEDKFLEVEAYTKTVAVSYTKKMGEDCVKGTNDCIEHRERRTKDVDVRVASATIDGRPLTIRDVAVAASPDFVSDTNRAGGLTSGCKRGRVMESIGGTAIIVGLTLLQRAFDHDNPNRNMAIGGYATLGGGIFSLGGGWLVFGGQHCGEAAAIYRRWEPIYDHSDETKVTGDAAEMLEVLVKKYNVDRAKVGSRQAETDEEVTP